MNSYTFWLGQFNIQRAQWRHAGDMRWSAALPRLVEVMKGKASVWILNEADPQGCQQIAAGIGRQYTWNRTPGPNGVNAVMQDETKWAEHGDLIQKTLVGNGTRSLLGSPLQRIEAPDSPVITFASFHLETMGAGYAKTQAAAQRLRDAQTNQVVDRLPSHHCVSGGDLNDTDVNSGPRALMAKAGLKPVSELVKVENAKIGTTDSGRRIDEQFVSDDIEVLEAKRVNPGRASDHHLTLVHLKVSW